MSANLITSRAVLGMMYERLTNPEANWVNRLAMTVNSNQASETYAWLGMTPAMREWAGGRTAKDVREFSFSIANKEHEASIFVKTSELRRDKTGQLQIRINELVERALYYPAKLLTTLIQNGEATTCYDGQYFFDTDHSEGDSGTQDNDLTYAASSGTTPTVDEMRAAMLQAVKAIIGFKDDRGELVNANARAFEFMVPLTYLQQAMEAVVLPTVSTGGANIMANLPGFSFTVTPNPQLTWTDKFVTFSNSGSMKPFILQQEVPATPVAIAEGSEMEVKEKRHMYGVDWDGNVGYGDWKKAALTTFT